MKALTLRRWSISALLVLALMAGCAQGPATRSDSEIAADVQNKINTDANLPNKTISVNANNGTVTLSGTVANETERLAAANDAAQVNGVKTVVNNLQMGSSAASMPAGSTAPANGSSAPRRATTTTAPRYPSTGSNMASAPAAVPMNEPKATVPSGAEMTVRINDEISSERVNAGDTFTATLDAPVYVGETIAIPANADVQGRVVEVKSAGKFAGRSELFLQLTRVSYNGHNYSINTNSWEKYGASRGKNTAAKVGGGAAIGAVIGAIAGGGKGAAIGAGVGAGAGTGAQAITKSEQIVLRPETLLTFTLKQPITVAASSSTRGTRTPMTNN